VGQVTQLHRVSICLLLLSDLSPATMQAQTSLLLVITPHWPSHGLFTAPLPVSYPWKMIPILLLIDDRQAGRKVAR